MPSHIGFIQPGARRISGARRDQGTRRAGRRGYGQYAFFHNLYIYSFCSAEHASLRADEICPLTIIENRRLDQSIRRG